MRYIDALARVREQQAPYFDHPDDPIEGSTNYVVSAVVGQIVLDTLGTEWVDFGTFDNCREWGLTFTVPGWQFCVYEHRNSDDLCLQGCPIEEVAPFGPYGGDSKYDVLVSVASSAGEPEEVRAALGACLIYALRTVHEADGPMSRSALKATLAAALVTAEVL